jgi:hypothetical protein
MNCKPGDLAVIVSSNDQRNIGKMVTILRHYDRRAGSWWIASTSVLHGVFSDWPPGAEVGQYDKNLRPIRDPGDDAVDESAAWLPPVPLPVIDPSLLPAKETA